MEYTFKDHLHNFAVWTAARAVSRNFTDTKSVKCAIEKTRLKELIDTREIFSPETFDQYHLMTAHIIMSHFRTINDEIGKKATYGRAAKIIAIYIKTIAIIRTGKGNLAKIAHPPIDRILLTNLHKDYKKLGLNKIKWTQLSEQDYFILIDKLRTIEFDYFWEMERYWSPER